MTTPKVLAGPIRRRSESAAGNDGGECAHRVEAAGAVFLGCDVPTTPQDANTSPVTHDHEAPSQSLSAVQVLRSDVGRADAVALLADRSCSTKLDSQRSGRSRPGSRFHRSPMGQRLGSGCFSGRGSTGWGAIAGEGSFTGEDSGSSTGSMKTVRRCGPMFMASPPRASGAVPHRTDERGGADKRSSIAHGRLHPARHGLLLARGRGSRAVAAADDRRTARVPEDRPDRGGEPNDR